MELGDTIVVSPRFYSQKKFIEVPCGTCPDCRNSYYSSLLQRCIVEAMTSYVYFITLTYDDKHLPSLLLNGQRFFFSDYQHIQDMFKRFRANVSLGRDFRYLHVNEYGTDKHRPHHHLIIFVAKKTTDDINTPFFIERQLFDGLKHFYAINIGTRKNPIYESLFTYQIKYTPQGVKTNYFVKYVQLDHDNYDVTQSDTLVKTIRYLISYINKPSPFDDAIADYLSTIKSTDLILYRKLSILRSRVHYSKGLGFGFINGVKHYLPYISVPASPNVSYYNSLIHNFPDSFSAFAQLYPTLSDQVLQFSTSLNLHQFCDIQDFYEHLSIHDFTLYCLCLRYFPQSMSFHIRSAFFQRLQPTISNLYAFCNPSVYALPKITTSSTIDITSPVFQLIRSYIRDGLNNKIPFLPFVIPGSTPTYTSLCKFYRMRCTTLKDIENMYDACGFSNYDEWSVAFENNLTLALKRCNISKANILRQSLSEFPICISDKESLSLYYKERDIYNILFT